MFFVCVQIIEIIARRKRKGGLEYECRRRVCVSCSLWTFFMTNGTITRVYICLTYQRVHAYPLDRATKRRSGCHCRVYIAPILPNWSNCVIRVSRPWLREVCALGDVGFLLWMELL